MKASSITNALWVASALALGLGGWQFYRYWSQRKTNLNSETPASLNDRLRAPKEQAQIGRRPWQQYDSIQVANVRGVAPPKPVAETESHVESKPAMIVNPLADIVDVRGIQFDSKGTGSRAIVSWKDPQISDQDRKRLVAIHDGDAFPKPYEKKWKVKRVEVDQVVFESDDGKEASRPVPKSKSNMLMTFGDGVGPASKPAGGGSGRPAGYAIPDATKKMSETEYWLSKNDFSDAQDRGLDVIGRDLQTTPYLDSKTHRPAGLRLKMIRPDSLPDKLGLREGDVVKGLNDMAIKSTADVYQFAKEHPDVRDVELSVERYGRVVKIVYRLPD